MYCYKCGAYNPTDGKFCYSCGTPARRNTKITRRNITIRGIVQKNLVISKNRYRNIFLIAVAISISLVLLAGVCKSLPDAVNAVIVLMDTETNMVSKAVIKGKIERSFRDIWCHCLLIVFFVSIISTSILMLVKAYLGNQEIKEKTRKF